MCVEDAKFNFALARAAIVDASNFGYRIARDVLSSFGFRDITGFESANQAVAKLALMPVDLVLCDPFPKVEESYAMLRRLREPRFGETSLAPIIIMTGSVSIDIVEGAKACRADYVIAKPYSPQTLLERIIWAANHVGRRDAPTAPHVELATAESHEIVELW